jgi:hypothetical protein
MQVLVRTDNHIAAHEQHLIRFAEDEAHRALARFADRLSRVDVHLADESGRAEVSGDKRCTVEARPLRGQPVSVSSTGATVGDALTDAVRKLADLLDSRFARQHDVKGAASIRH